MRRLGFERLLHRGLRVLDRALAIAREAVVHPGVSPARFQLDRRGEGLLGARGLVERRKSLAIGVMRRREFWGAPACFARRDELGLVVPERQMRDGGVQEGSRIVRQRGLDLLERGERLGVPPRGLERDAELEVCLRTPWVELDRPTQELYRGGDVVGAQRVNRAAEKESLTFPIPFVRA